MTSVCVGFSLAIKRVRTQLRAHRTAYVHCTCVNVRFEIKKNNSNHCHHESDAPCFQTDNHRWRFFIKASAKLERKNRWTFNTNLPTASALHTFETKLDSSPWKGNIKTKEEGCLPTNSGVPSSSLHSSPSHKYRLSPKSMIFSRLLLWLSSIRFSG